MNQPRGVVDIFFLLLIALVVIGLTSAGVNFGAVPMPFTLPSTGTGIQSASAPEESSYSLTTVEIADTESERERGLSGRATIPHDFGLLFIFPEKGLHGFWMKDMKASIDIIWLKDDGSILSIEDSVAPSTYPETFSPPAPVRYVLETRAGEAEAQGWQKGTRLSLPLR